VLKLDLIATLAFGGVVLFLGYGLLRVIPPLARYNLPAPVVGGLPIAALTLAYRQRGVTLFEFDTALREPLMIAFFTTIGFGASLGLLKKGGPQVMLFFVLATVAAVLQNVVGAGLALSLGQPPLFGVLCGSVTLTGGPSTGLAFADSFEQAGISGAAPVAVAAAMVGIVSGCLMGGPVATFLIDRLPRSNVGRGEKEPVPATAAHVVEDRLPEPAEEAPPGEDREAFLLLRSVGVILVAMWAGSWISGGLTALKVTLPAYIGAMLVAALLRNLDDVTGWLGLSQRSIDDLGNVALSFFLVLALMTLELWKLAGVALPMLVILAGQLALVAALCLWPIFPAMGRDYDAAVMAGGFCGFMLGTTANAMANMHALTQRYGPSPRSFLVVPMVGAFFIDFTNALIIWLCLELQRL
jgi:ESS family glutamate:Na+ symporter